MGRYYKDLIVWQKAITLLTDVYRAARQFPKGARKLDDCYTACLAPLKLRTEN